MSETTKRLQDAPLGTKARAIGGGHWVKVERGWKWHNGDTFPTPGADWDGTLTPPTPDLDAVVARVQAMVDADVWGAADLRALLAAHDRLAAENAALRAELTAVIRAWESDWDCSASPGHEQMEHAINSADVALEALEDAARAPHPTTDPSDE